MPLRGTLPLTVQGSSSAGSVVIWARPLTRKRLAQAGHEEDQPDPRAVQQVADRVDPVVAEPVGDQQRLVVEHPDKARRVALGRGVAAAFGSQAP